MDSFILKKVFAYSKSIENFEILESKLDRIWKELLFESRHATRWCLLLLPNKRVTAKKLLKKFYKFRADCEDTAEKRLHDWLENYIHVRITWAIRKTDVMFHERPNYRKINSLFVDLWSFVVEMIEEEK